MEHELARDMFEPAFAISRDQITDLQRAALEEAQRVECAQPDQLGDDAVAIPELDGLACPRVVADQADAADVTLESAGGHFRRSPSADCGVAVAASPTGRCPVRSCRRC